jgi:hypothetical protein
MVEVSEVRKRLLATIERAKRTAGERRVEADAAQRDYDRFLAETAVPVFKKFGISLRALGYPFALSTPEGSVRLVSERSASDFLEVDLDTSRRPAAVVGRSVFARGRELRSAERQLREGASIAELTDEDVLEFLLAEIEPYVV